MKSPKNSNYDVDSPDRLGGKGRVSGECERWTERIVRRLIMSESDLDLVVNIQSSSLKLVSDDSEEDFEIVPKSRDEVQVLMDGSVQANSPVGEILGQINEKLEEEGIARRSRVWDIMEGRDRNLLSGFTTLITMLRIVFLLKNNNEKKEIDCSSSRRLEDKSNHEIGPYF